MPCTKGGLKEDEIMREGDQRCSFTKVLRAGFLEAWKKNTAMQSSKLKLQLYIYLYIYIFIYLYIYIFIYLYIYIFIYIYRQKQTSLPCLRDRKGPMSLKQSEQRG